MIYSASKLDDDGGPLPLKDVLINALVYRQELENARAWARGARKVVAFTKPHMDDSRPKFRSDPNYGLFRVRTLVPYKGSVDLKGGFGPDGRKLPSGRFVRKHDNPGQVWIVARSGLDARVAKSLLGRYSGESLREIRKTHGVGRPPEPGSPGAPISVPIQGAA